MGLLQAAYETYNNHQDLVGEITTGKKALLPVSHIYVKPGIKIIIDSDGEFNRSEYLNEKSEQVIIPVTIESSGRTGDIAPHPLSDKLKYLLKKNEKEYSAYIDRLTRWAESEHSHEKVRAILKYIEKQTIEQDLIRSNEPKVTDGQKLKKDIYEKTVIFKVNSLSENGIDECWRDRGLFDSYEKFYADEISQQPRNICYISGEEDIVCQKHLGSLMVFENGAKLISSKDENFKYRGRFTSDREAYNVGYYSSRKSNHALKWIIDNWAYYVGRNKNVRAFICWNPKGKDILCRMAFGDNSITNVEVEEYKKELGAAISGYRNIEEDGDYVVVASLDAATPGRCSITYYNQIMGSDFVNRIGKWYGTLLWDSYIFKCHSPRLETIINCAYGKYIDNKNKKRDNGSAYMFETSERIMIKEYQSLVRCIVESRAIPINILHALVAKADNLHLYDTYHREMLLSTTCAVIRKYINDRSEEEEVWKLSLDKDCTNRSYLFGRLLAIAEKVEKRALYQKSGKDSDDGRETNAMRMQHVFSRRPLKTWEILHGKLQPYFERLSPGLAFTYRSQISDIMEKFDVSDQLDQKLGSIYLLGYYHQRSDLFKRDDKDKKGEEIDE